MSVVFLGTSHRLPCIVNYVLCLCLISLVIYKTLKGFAFLGLSPVSFIGEVLNKCLVYLMVIITAPVKTTSFQTVSGNPSPSSNGL